ncbi:MAG: methyltransferase domain-containing protein [Pelagibacterales bacterium]|nr:methyltransferase domain-containing protein [Pelagibacterales bacterium]
MNQHNFLPGKINKCQICNSDNLIDVLNIGDQALANSLILDKANESKIEKFPINIVRCTDCTLLQLDYIADQKKVYHLDYPYLPGITKTVNNEQKELSDYLTKELKLGNKDLAVDIGSNDGSLLNHLKKNNLKVVGVEPTNIAKIANKNGIKTIQSFFNEETAEKIAMEYGKAKLITSTNVFAHMTTLGDEMNGIKRLLDEEGYYCFVNHYIIEILEKVQYDTFYHEHLRTYSLISLDKLFQLYDLHLIDAQIVTRYGGSIRCVVSKTKKSKSQRLISLIEKEKKLLIDNTEKTYETFNLNVMNSKKNLINKILELKNENKKIIAKSCPARAVVLLNYCKLNSTHLEYIAEQPTSLKLNYYVPGTGLKIVNDDILEKDQPDYVLLLAWHLSNPIINKWKKKGLKSKFIIPLPNVEIL